MIKYEPARIFFSKNIKKPAEFLKKLSFQHVCGNSSSSKRQRERRFRRRDSNKKIFLKISFVSQKKIKNNFAGVYLPVIVKFG